jgi:hypothetical protein
MIVKKDHLKSKASFQFALSVAVVAVLVAILITLVGQVGTMMTMSSRAEGVEQLSR